MINVDEISNIVNNRNRMKKETYVELYKQITRKIRRAVDTNRKHVVIEIPAFVIGYPTFNRLKALIYLKRQLELAGFDVAVIGDYEINITWRVKRPNRDSSRLTSMDEFPTLINLKKAANQYRRNAQNI
jgi:hypothetical protein|tara:strand:- start:19339 stop:19725 length:387 start_codon:yes stop_codon:yes gene_type:complete